MVTTHRVVVRIEGGNTLQRAQNSVGQVVEQGSRVTGLMIRYASASRSNQSSLCLYPNFNCIQRL